MLASIEDTRSSDNVRQVECWFSHLVRLTPAAVVAKQVTTTIPIVMAIVGTPVETGIVASIARPGGNITGSSISVPEINAKRLELIKTGGRHPKSPDIGDGSR